MLYDERSGVVQVIEEVRIVALIHIGDIMRTISKTHFGDVTEAAATEHVAVMEVGPISRRALWADVFGSDARSEGSTNEISSWIVGDTNTDDA